MKPIPMVTFKDQHPERNKSLVNQKVKKIVQGHGLTLHL
jgi:hypothetical protein